jgi:hypothetical protein
MVKAAKKLDEKATTNIRLNPLNRRAVCLLLVFTLLVTAIDTVQAATESLNIQAGEDSVRKIGMSSGDHISITFTILSQSSSFFRFWVVFPNGTKSDYGEATNRNISFASDVQGECELHFDNTNSSSAQLVTLNYEIEHYYFGIPEIPFLIIVIAVLLLCIVAGYIIMGKYS